MTQSSDQDNPSAELIAKREAMLQNRGNNCFVCGPSNPIGLGVVFRLEKENSDEANDEALVCRAEFTPQSQHMGYDNVTHGGIVFSLLDDVMANWLWLQGQQCFTAKADIRYRGELPVGTAVVLEGRCLKRKGRLAQMEGRIIGASDGKVFAEATAAFMTPAS